MSDDEPTVGQKVLFESARADKGPKAVNVYLQSDIELGADALAGDAL